MTEIERMLSMNYDECCEYLINKYGKILGDYFLTPLCKSQNKKIKRTQDGLFIHHIDEDKAIMLSTPMFAINNPFDFQKADRLVYCNLLEHLVLHIKIVEFPSPNKIPGNDVGIGGIVNFLVPEINAIYSGLRYYGKQSWKNKSIDLIINQKDDYLKCIKKIVDLGINEKYSLFTAWQNWDISKCIDFFKEMKKVGVKK